MGKVAELPRGQSSKKTETPDFIAGQVWRLGDRSLEIRKVGPILIHYRWSKPNVMRPSRELFASQREIHAMLQANKGVLDKTQA